MTLLSILPLSLLVGMAHALEADHLAAVSNMLTRKGGRAALARRGMFWGIGHTVALFAVCSVVVILGLAISDGLQAGFELVVGLMIVLLAGQTLWRLHRDRVHAHVHEHDGTRHLHLHSHAGETLPHSASSHRHEHRATDLKTLAVGLVHGTAGSGALLVLAVSATQSLWEALAYFAVFGLGSMLGMAAVSAVASVPLGWAQQGATWLRNGVSGAIGVVGVWIGGSLALESAAALHAF